MFTRGLLLGAVVLIVALAGRLEDDVLMDSGIGKVLAEHGIDIPSLRLAHARAVSPPLMSVHTPGRIIEFPEDPIPHWYDPRTWGGYINKHDEKWLKEKLFRYQIMPFFEKMALLQHAIFDEGQILDTYEEEERKVSQKYLERLGELSDFGKSVLNLQDAVDMNLMAFMLNQQEEVDDTLKRIHVEIAKFIHKATDAGRELIKGFSEKIRSLLPHVEEKEREVALKSLSTLKLAIESNEVTEVKYLNGLHSAAVLAKDLPGARYHSILDILSGVGVKVGEAACHALPDILVVGAEAYGGVLNAGLEEAFDFRTREIAQFAFKARIFGGSSFGGGISAYVTVCKKFEHDTLEEACSGKSITATIPFIPPIFGVGIDMPFTIATDDNFAPVLNDTQCVSLGATAGVSLRALMVPDISFQESTFLRGMCFNNLGDFVTGIIGIDQRVRGVLGSARLLNPLKSITVGIALLMAWAKDHCANDNVCSPHSVKLTTPAGSDGLFALKSEMVEAASEAHALISRLSEKIRFAQISTITGLKYLASNPECLKSDYAKIDQQIKDCDGDTNCLGYQCADDSGLEECCTNYRKRVDFAMSLGDTHCLDSPFALCTGSSGGGQLYRCVGEEPLCGDVLKPDLPKELAAGFEGILGHRDEARQVFDKIRAEQDPFLLMSDEL